MQNTKKRSVREETVRRGKPGPAEIIKYGAVRDRALKGLRAAEVKTTDMTLADLRVAMRVMGLDELLSVSECISRSAHGERPSLTVHTTDLAEKCVEKILSLPPGRGKNRAIAMLNAQIVAKNRAGVNIQSAERAYAEFIRTD